MSALKIIALAAAVGSVGLASASAAQKPALPPASAQRLEGASWSVGAVKPDPGLTDAVQRTGREVFQARCETCHGALPKDMSPGLPARAGTIALEAKYKGSKPALLEQRTDLTPQTVAFFVRKGTGIMPFFRPTELTDDELAALGAYLSRKKR